MSHSSSREAAFRLGRVKSFPSAFRRGCGPCVDFPERAGSLGFEPSHMQRTAAVRKDRSFPLASLQVANGHAGRNGRDFGETDATGPIAISSAFSASRRRCDRSRVRRAGAAWRATPCEEARFARWDARAELFCAPAVVSPPVTPGRFRLPRRPDPGARSVRRRPGRARGPCPGPAPC